MCVKFCEMKSFDKYNFHYVELFISSLDKINAVAVRRLIPKGQNLVPTSRHRFGGQPCMGVVSQIIDLDSTAL